MFSLDTVMVEIFSLYTSDNFFLHLKILQEVVTTIPSFLLVISLLYFNLQDLRYESAIELLRKQVAVQSTSRLHQMLADLFSRVHDEEKAAHHFGIALK